MMRKFALAAGLSLLALSPNSALAGNKDYALKGFSMPSDKPVTIMLMRPDVQVGELAAGGLPTPNADWTKAAREHLANALSANQKKRNIDFKIVSPSTPEGEQVVADYEGLHRAVANSIVEFAYGSKLPTKKGKTKKDHVFDWTLGPGTQQIGDLTGGNYALFFFARDNFASASRKAMQVAGMLGCIVGACVIVSGGQHVAYASLVESSTGNVVWFNILRGSKGDVREADGAQSMVDAIMDSMPTRAGEAPPAPTKKRK
jgi:hypothetical protein